MERSETSLTRALETILMNINLFTRNSRSLLFVLSEVIYDNYFHFFILLIFEKHNTESLSGK